MGNIEGKSISNRTRGRYDSWTRQLEDLYLAQTSCPPPPKTPNLFFMIETENNDIHQFSTKENIILMANFLEKEV
jgi:hypothetical protein